MAAIPTPHIHKVDQMNIPTKQHSGTISINDIKRFDFKTENGKNIFYIYLYDTLDQTDTGLPLDYMLKSDNTTDVNDFDGCSFLPLYAADGKDINKYVQPHFNEIIDMFDDIKEAGNFEETNPGARGQYEHLYDCVIVSPTRTQIHTGLKDGKCIFNHKLINSNATKGTTLWLGRTIKETVDGQEKDIAHFLKLKITKYVIENYYAGYGSIENTGVDYGTFKPVDATAAEGIYVVEGVRVLKSTEIEFVKDDFTLCKNAVYTNICTSTATSSTKSIVNFIGKSDLETFTPINFYTEGTTTIPIMGCYNVPGYYNYLKSIENDSEQQILGSPLVVKVPTLITVTTANYAAFGTKKVQYDITVTGTAADGYTVTMQNSFNGAEYYTVENGQMTRHLPDLAYKMTGGDIETNDSINYIPRKLNEVLIKYLLNFNNLHLAGSPQFTVIKGTETTNNVKLQYYNGATFTNCEIDDAPETDKAIPPWYMNCTFPGSEVRLDNYNDVVKTITVIGDENENIIGFDDSSRLNPRLNPRFIRSGRGYNQQNDKIHLKDLDDLYALLMTTHDRAILPTEPAIAESVTTGYYYIKTDKKLIYTARNGNIPASLVMKGENEEGAESCFLIAEIVDANNVKFKLGIEVNDTNTTADFQVHKITQNEGQVVYEPTASGKYNNIYYGIVGTEYGQKIQEINTKICTVVLGDNSTVTITPKVYESTTNQKTMSDLVKEFKTIFERMPLNSTFLYEISGILEKIYSFEANRVPYINQSTEATANTTPETSGFEKKDDSNVLKVTETSYTLRDNITVQKVEGADLYKFKEGGAHDKLIKSMENALLYCNGFCTTSDNEKIYSTLSSMMTQWENYYAGQAPDNSTDVSPTSIDNAEFEIYEDESVYKVFVASVDTGEVSVVTGLTSNGTKPEQGQTDPLVEFISTILKQYHLL